MLYTVERVGNQLHFSTPTRSQQPCVHGQSSTHDMRLSDIRPRTYAGIFELWRYFQRLEGCRVS
jgi:hypothetical protein